MATMMRRDFRKFEADPQHESFDRWPIKRLTGVEIELVGNSRSNYRDDDFCGCGNACPNGGDCDLDYCDYCHADHSDEPFDSDSAVDQACGRHSCSIVSDGSLGETGLEIVTPAMAGHWMPLIIGDLCRAVAREGLTANHSCGLHVHADARDLTWYDMRRIMLGYVIAEPFLRMIVPPRRRNSTYASDCGFFYRDMLRLGQTTKDTKTAVIYGIYGLSLDGASGSKRNRRDNAEWWQRQKREKYATNQRYRSLNVHSWIHRGTLEWRLPPGTRRAETILGYARTFHDVIRYSLHATERDLWTRIKDMDRSLRDGSGRRDVDLSRNLLEGVWSSDWTINRFQFFAGREDRNRAASGRF